MRIACVGGGPAALFFAIVMKRLDPAHDIHVLERNRPDDTFGFGVVFSDATMAGLAEAEPETFARIAEHLVHWDDIDVHVDGAIVSSTGHGFSGISRRRLLQVLHEQARTLGVRLSFDRDVRGLDDLEGGVAAYDLVLGADGVNSVVREALAPVVRPHIDVRSNRFVWLGTPKPFPAFTFYFKHDAHGLWRVHAYQFEPHRSTFIVECREETWRRAGLDRASEAETVTFLERLFAEELAGYPLLANRSLWRQFPTVRCERWSSEQVVLVGDAAHTAHFSVGSGTRLAMEDALSLRNALIEAEAARPAAAVPDREQRRTRVRDALARFEAQRRPQVESLQRAAQASLQWFEEVERYRALPPLQFTFALLTRSLRITHEDLRQRDPRFLARLDAWFAERAFADAGVRGPAAVASDAPAAPTMSGGVVAASATAAVVAPVAAPALASPSAVPPPMFTPLKLRDLVLANRIVVSPMCQYTAINGTVSDWHLVHLGARAVGGAGLLIAEMTDVSAEARISPGCAGLYSSEHAAAWKRIVDFVHRESDAKIGIQLGHAGRKAATCRSWEGDNEPLPPDEHWPLVSASPLAYFPDRSQIPREMTRADMLATIGDYVRATELAIAAGFDLLEIHMAHGYLLASFVSPLTNQRQDAYGGSLDNRLRFPLEVFAACRAAWPAEKPMSVRISATDWRPEGLSGEDSVAIARQLAAHGCDIVDVSAGQTVPDQRPQYGRLFQTSFADRIRHEAGIRTMAVGNISSYMDVNTILASGRADLCLLARAHLFDPFWTRHAAYTLGWPLPWPDPYRAVERYTPRFEFRFS